MQTRDQLVKAIVDEYRKSGEKAAIALFDSFIKKYGISQLGIRSTILDFRAAIAVDGGRK